MSGGAAAVIDEVAERRVGTKEELFAVIRQANEEFDKLDPNEQEFLRREILPPYGSTDNLRQR